MVRGAADPAALAGAVKKEIREVDSDLPLYHVRTMTDWVADATEWWRVRWLPAFAADAAVVWLVVQSAGSQDPQKVISAVAVALALFGTSFASSSVRMLAVRKDVTRFDIAQSAAAFVVGYGGAAYTARASGLTTIPFGLPGLLLGASVYGVAFWRDSAALSRRNFYYFSTMAIALVIAGGSLAFSPPLAASLWIVLAPAGVLLGRRYLHATLSSHGAVYLVAAAAASGLFLQAGYGLLGPATRPWPAVTVFALAALAAAAVCSAVAPVGVRTLRATNVVMAIAGRRTYLGVPRALALAILILGLAGVSVARIVAAVPGSPGPESNWGVVATIRTLMLSGAAILMSGLARGDRVREAGRLVYPLFIAAGLKILVEDFRHSEPATLFVALVVYGSALILAPRLASK